MKVFQLTLRADIGGGPEHLYQLIAHLPSRFEVYVACPNDEPYRGRFANLIGDSRIIDVPHRAFSLAALRRLSNEISSCGATLIHCHGKGAGLYGRLLSLITGQPCVHTFHGLHVGEYRPVERIAYLGLEALLGLATAAAVCVSRGEHNEILRAGFLPRSKIHVVENGVEMLPLRVAEPQTVPFQLVAVNRYDVQKNPELLLDIAASLMADPTMPTFRITVLGTGERLVACREAVKRRGLTDIIDLVGPSTNPRASFRAAHAFLSTSRWEGMPMAVLEAMSEGLPVVASDVVGNRDVVTDNVNGVLFESENALAGAAAVRRIVNPALRARLGASARRTVEERFSVTKMAERTARLYDMVLAQR